MDLAFRLLPRAYLCEAILLRGEKPMLMGAPMQRVDMVLGAICRFGVSVSFCSQNFILAADSALMRMEYQNIWL